MRARRRCCRRIRTPTARALRFARTGGRTTNRRWDSPPSTASPSGSVTFTQDRHTPVRHGARWRVEERAQYEVRIRRTTADSTSDRVFDEIYWSALRTITDRDPIITPVPLARTAIRIKATDQLHGEAQQINAVVKSIVPDWDSATNTWIERASSNPASLMRAALQNPARPVPAPDSRINLEAGRIPRVLRCGGIRVQRHPGLQQLSSGPPSWISVLPADPPRWTPTASGR